VFLLAATVPLVSAEPRYSVTWFRSSACHAIPAAFCGPGGMRRRVRMVLCSSWDMPASGSLVSFHEVSRAWPERAGRPGSSIFVETRNAFSKS
jgi:hypothetical protein